MVLLYHNLHTFDIQNWITQEIVTSLLKILITILKPHCFEKNCLWLQFINTKEKPHLYPLSASKTFS